MKRITAEGGAGAAVPHEAYDGAETIMSQQTFPGGGPLNYTFEPSYRGKWMRRAVVGIVFVALAILFLQATRPNFGNAKDNIPWRTNLTQALAESKQTGKPVLVDFSASWCGPCQEMKHSAWPDKKVEEAVKANYIPVLLDTDRPEAEEPGKHYQVEYIPAVFILDGDGKVIKRGDFMSASELLKFLTEKGKPAPATP